MPYIYVAVLTLSFDELRSVVSATLLDDIFYATLLDYMFLISFFNSEPIILLRSST